MRRVARALFVLSIVTGCGSSGGGAGSGSGSGGAAGSGGSAGAGTGGAGALGGAGGTGGAPLGSSFGKPQELASKQTNSFRVVVASGRVFWNQRGDPTKGIPGGLYSMPTGGGATAQHVSETVYAVKHATNQVYWSDSAGIHAMNADGSQAKLVAPTSGQPAHDFAVAGAWVWWTASGSSPLTRAPLAGGAPEPLPLSAPQVFAGYIVGDSANVFAQLATYGDPFIFQIPVGDPTAATTLVENVNLSQNALDETFLYYAVKTGPVRRPLAGGDAEPLGSLESVQAIALEPGAAYVTSDPSNGCLKGAGQVHRIDLVTKEMTLIADGQTCPAGVAVDASGVHWVNSGTALDTTAYLSDPETGALMFAKRM